MNIIGIDTRQLRGSQRNQSFRAQESKHAEHCHVLKTRFQRLVKIAERKFKELNPRPHLTRNHRDGHA